MFEFLKKKNEIEVYAPVSGYAVSLDEVPDTMFSERMLGDGVAVEYKDKTVKSPVNGKVTMIAPTMHAVGLKTKEGAELLIHVGINTVELEGKGFKSFVQVNDQVNIGTNLLQIDFDYMESKKINLITPIIVTNKEKFTVSNIYTGSIKSSKTPLFLINKKRG